MVEFITTLPARISASRLMVGFLWRLRLVLRALIGLVGGLRLGEYGRALGLFAAVALVMRAGTIGFPVIHIDEQFYLLVGERMWQGDLPFVDIWDRKPLGLFLVFAAIRLLGGEGIIQYQLVAMSCVVATSMVIYAMARQVARPAGALVAGAVYAPCLAGFLCIGGQAPVFYNLLMALAGWLMLRLWCGAENGGEIGGESGGSGLTRGGLAVMALVGLALQIKYTVVFEGIGFGLALMWLGWRRGWHRARLVGMGAVWAGMALVPTLAAWGAYIALGHGAAFFQANFLSIFGRHEEMGGALVRLAKEMGALTPVWLAIFWAPSRLPPLPLPQTEARGFLRYWSAVAVAGFLLFGTWYDHYVAPMLVPLLALSAPALAAPRPLRWVTQLLVVASFAVGAGVSVANLREHGNAAQVDAAARMIGKALARPVGNPCLYINEGDPILYHKTRACFATRFVFPNHLNGMVDAAALGVDPMDEVRAIMDSRPQAVVMTVRPSALPANWQTRAFMFERLGRDYRLAGMVDVGWRKLLVYERRRP